MIHQGDCLEILRNMPDQSVNCCVTSPPYYGLRDYGVDGQIGLETSPNEYVAKLVEVFREVRRVLRDDGTLWLNLGDSYANSGKGAWDKTDVQKEVYVPAPGGKQTKYKTPGLKPKDLIGIPWMVAFALRDDGAANSIAMREIEKIRTALLDIYDVWEQVPDKLRVSIERLDREREDAHKGAWFLRQDIIWSKPNPMPESVMDRCTKSHEYIFLLSKSQRYYCDMESIKEEASFPNGANSPESIKSPYGQGVTRKNLEPTDEQKDAYFNNPPTNLYRCGGDGEKRNKRSVWTVSTQPYAEAHFATFPPKLIKPCVLAGCPEGGIVLDPFAGSGTTGEVAVSLGRNYELIELNPEYIKLIKKRINSVAPLFQREA